MVINPWGALRAEKRRASLLAEELATCKDGLHAVQQRAEAAKLDARSAGVELAATRKMLEATAAGLAEATKKNALLTYDMRAMRDELDGLKYNYENMNDWCDKYVRIIAKGHFRNPETGRIGPVGKVYE